MSDQDYAKLQAELHQAFVMSIKKVGLSAFKATSMFGSSDRVVSSQQKVA